MAISNQLDPLTHRISIGLACVWVAAAALACKGKSNDSSAPADSASAAPTPAPPDTSASEQASSTPPPAKTKAPATAAKPANAACHGLMIDKRCAKECTKDDDCKDPKESCQRFSGSDDDGQDVMGAMLCIYDKDAPPRTTGNSAAAAPPSNLPVQGAPKTNGECPKGYVAEPWNDDKCDKQCTSAAECGPNGMCQWTGVGPQSIMQCSVAK